MAITFSLKNIVRLLVFIVVFGLVMSVALLVEARDIPSVAKAVPDTVGSILQPEQHGVLQGDSVYELTDIPDGLASWYGRQFQGRRTASGRAFNRHEMTAAHRTLPFGSLIHVVNPSTGKSVIVEVTDRGPFIRRRVVDLSEAAARELGITVSPVTMRALTLDEVNSFYRSNDSTVLAIDGRQNVVVLQRGTIDIDDESMGLTQAVRCCGDGKVVVIGRDDSAITFQVAAIAPTE